MEARNVPNMKGNRHRPDLIADLVFRELGAQTTFRKKIKIDTTVALVVLEIARASP